MILDVGDLHLRMKLYMLMKVDMPTISKSRDHGELQDMYRRALAASWAAHADELPADQCLEDIFNGGDGWKAHDKVSTPRITHDDSGEERNLRFHHRSTSGASSKSATSQSTVTGKRIMRNGHKHSRSRETLGPSPQSIVDMHDTSSENSSERGRTGFKKAPELDEFDIRDDLVAWDYQVRYLDSLYGVYKSREAYSRHAAAIVGLEDIDFWASSLPQL